MEFSNITEDDIKGIVSLTQKHLTDGEYVEACILRQVKAGNYFGVKATSDGELAGFLTFKEGIDFTYPHPELEEEMKKESKGRKVFNGDAIYVNPKFRKCGIGGHLTAMARDRMIELGGYYFLGELWIHPDGKIPALTPTAIYGETEFKKIVPMFYKDIGKYGLVCPICGENCICGAVVCLIRLDPGPKDEQDSKKQQDTL